MHDLILSELKKIELEHEIRILYAVQAGSRAWGFPSAHSDWDIRFIYQHPLDWYLSLDKKRDVIEKQAGGVLELSGWDLKKTMGLLNKSNPSILEWLQTEDKLIEDKYFCEKILPLQSMVYSPISCFHHYLSMSKTNWHKWKRQRDSVKSTKLTLHLLRGILCCIWIVEKKSFPSVEFSDLFHQTVQNPKIKEEIERIVGLKKNGVEKIEVNSCSLSSFIDIKMNELGRDTSQLKQRQTDSHQLVNQVFADLVKKEL
ncbi:MAG: nucleotidyltransferase domain-containing protein [Bacillota bacterium]